jgi:hypothetical protein
MVARGGGPAASIDPSRSNEGLSLSLNAPLFFLIPSPSLFSLLPQTNSPPANTLPTTMAYSKVRLCGVIAAGFEGEGSHFGT